MGAVVVTQPTNGSITQNLGQRYVQLAQTVTMSTSYATGGDTITPAQIGFGAQIDLMWVCLNSLLTGTFLFLLRKNTGVYTIQAFTAAASTGLTTPLGEVTAGTDLSAYPFDAAFMGV